MRKVLVVGATGTVGRGMVEVMIGRGWHVLAASRGTGGLDALKAHHATEHLTTTQGSLETFESAAELADAADAAALEAVVVATSTVWEPTPISEISYETIIGLFARDLRLHVNAARVLVPRLRRGAVYLAMGGGMADFTFPGMGPVSMGQAAQRAYLKSWHKESTESGVAVRELLIASMVRGHGRDEAQKGTLTAVEIAEHAADVLDRPDEFDQPVITIDPRHRQRHTPAAAPASRPDSRHIE